MEAIKLTFVAIMFLFLPYNVEGGQFYCNVKPPNGAPMVRIGPWPSRVHVQDWCGSALYLHPPECFNNPTNFNCRIVGNGFVYPSGYQYPVPVGKELVDCACYKALGPHPIGGNYFLSYATPTKMMGPYGSDDRLGMSQCEKKRKAAIGLVGSRCFCVGVNCIGPTR